VAGAASTPIDEPVGLDEVCMVQYTSGTSGRPKGVMLSHANITWNCYSILLDVDVTTDEVSLVSAPMFHTAALNQLCLPTFLKGGHFDPRVGIRSRARIRPHRRARSDVDVRRPDDVPQHVPIATVGRGRPDLGSDPHVRRRSGAGDADPRYQDRGLTFLQGYGLTETSPGALFLRAKQSIRKVGSAGTPCFFTDVRVVRPDMSDVTVGEVGEVVIEGPNVTTGYWRQPEATQRAFHDGGWFRSGDAASVDDEGYVYIVEG